MKTWTIEDQRASGRKSYYKYREQNLKRAKARFAAIREETLTYYSGAQPKCACCGIWEMAFLALDHIEGGGHASRKLHGNSYRYYQYLKREGYPTGYRVLCHNCNQATSHARTCPHELLNV